MAKGDSCQLMGISSLQDSKCSSLFAQNPAFYFFNKYQSKVPINPPSDRFQIVSKWLLSKQGLPKLAFLSEEFQIIQVIECSSQCA